MREKVERGRVGNKFDVHVRPESVQLSCSITKIAFAE